MGVTDCQQALASVARYAFNDYQTFRRATPLVPNSCSDAWRLTAHKFASKSLLSRTGCLRLEDVPGHLAEAAPAVG